MLKDRLAPSELASLLKLDIDLAKILKISVEDMAEMIDQLSPVEIEEILASPHVQERIERLLATPELPADRGRRQPRGSMKRFAVIDSEHRIRFSTQDFDDACDMADNRNRQVLDLTNLQPFFRRQVSRVLKGQVAGSHFSPPEPRAIPFREPPDKALERESLTSELRREVAKLVLPPDVSREIFNAVLEVAQVCGRDAALDVLIEIDLMLYTQVFDTVENVVVGDFEDHKEAGDKCRELNELHGPILDPKTGRSAGRYRYKIQKPEGGETE